MGCDMLMFINRLIRKIFNGITGRLVVLLCLYRFWKLDDVKFLISNENLFNFSIILSYIAINHDLAYVCFIVAFDYSNVKFVGDALTLLNSWLQIRSRQGKLERNYFPKSSRTSEIWEINMGVSRLHVSLSVVYC